MTPVAFLHVSRADYTEFRNACVDGVGLPVAYDTYLQKLRKFEETVKVKGVATAQVSVKPSEFVAWCKSAGKKTDTRARAEYAALRYSQLNKVEPCE